MTANSSPTKKRGKALDVLEKHISQQNKKPKNNQYGALSSMFQTITDSIKLPAPVSQPRPRMISSSPPRRVEQPFGIRQHPTSKSPEPPSRRSSPKKSVAFSDQIDSSPPPASLHSSPHRSSQAVPSKPILKFTLPLARTPSPRRKNNQPGFNDKLTIDQRENESSEDPMSLSYWVSGEVHGLGDIKSISEFKDVLTGGLYFLSSDIPEAKKRYFEIYATFNNIMPIFTSPNYSEVKDKKVQILAQNMNVILATCIPHLISIQGELLSSLKKDPFTSRIYVQIVRFFNALFSNFKLVKICENNQSFQTALHKVVESFTEAIQHPNSNKVMVTAQLALLRDEQCGIKRLTPLKVQSFVKSLANMKKISSSNLTCEKLLLLKIFLAKYPEVMFETIDIWLPAEVLSRLLIEEEFYSLKIANNCVSILLDLLKRCLTDRDNHQVLEVLKQTTTKELFSVNCEGNKTLAHLQTREDNLETLLRKRVIYLIEEKDEPKLAMDLWLAMVGLLFNSAGEVSSLCSDRGKLWLDLNLRYQNNSNPKAKKLALRSWRIVTYMICSKRLADIGESQKLVAVLLDPFSYLSKDHFKDPDYESLIYVLNGLLYSTLCNHHKDQFTYNLEFILSPFINEILMGQKSLKIRKVALEVLLRVVNQSPGGPTPKKEFNALKVVTSSGVEAADFIPFSSPLLSRNWHALMSIVQKCKQTSPPETYDLSFTLLLAVIERIPQRAIDGTTRDNCSATLLPGTEDSEQKPRSRMTDALASLMRTFKDLMCEPSPIINKLCLEIATAIKNDEIDCTDMLKTVLKETSNSISYLEVYSFFLRLKDTRIDDFIYNSISSKILSPKISAHAFEAFIDIVNSYSSTEIIQAFLDTSEKGSFDLWKASKLDTSRWDFGCTVRYFTMRFQREDLKVDDEFVSQFSSALTQHSRLAEELRKSLGVDRYAKSVVKLLEQEKRTDSYSLDSQWKLSMISCFSKDDYLEMLKFVADLREDVQLLLINGAQNNDESLHLSLRFIQLLISSEKQTVDDIKNGCDRALYGLLEKCYQKKLLCLLNQCVLSIIENDAYYLFEKFWATCGPDFLNLLENSTLATIMNQAASKNEVVINIFNFVFEQKPTDYVLGLMENVLAQDQLPTLNCCREKIINFLVREGIRSNEGGRKKVLAIFERASEVLIFQHKRLLAEFMRSLISKLPAEKGEFVYDLLSFICKDERFKLKGYDNLLVKINHGLPLASDTFQSEKKRETQRYKFHSAPQTPPNKTSSVSEAAAYSLNQLPQKVVEMRETSPSDATFPSCRKLSSNLNQQRKLKESAAASETKTLHALGTVLNDQKHMDTSDEDQSCREKKRIPGLNNGDKALGSITPPEETVCSSKDDGLTPHNNEKGGQDPTHKLTEISQKKQITVSEVAQSKLQASRGAEALSEKPTTKGQIKQDVKSQDVSLNDEVETVAVPTPPKNHERSTTDAAAQIACSKLHENAQKIHHGDEVHEKKSCFEETQPKAASASALHNENSQISDGEKRTSVDGKVGSLVIEQSLMNETLMNREGFSRGTDLSNATGIKSTFSNVESLAKIPIFNSRKLISKNKQPVTCENKSNEGVTANKSFKELPGKLEDFETIKRKNLHGSVYSACEDKKLKVILQIMKEFGVNEFSQLSDVQKQFVKQEMIKFLSKSNAS
ncbi:RIF1-like protein [Lachancea thermotolerans]